MCNLFERILVDICTEKNDEKTINNNDIEGVKDLICLFNERLLFSQKSFKKYFYNEKYVNEYDLTLISDLREWLDDPLNKFCDESLDSFREMFLEKISTLEQVININFKTGNIIVKTKDIPELFLQDLDALDDLYDTQNNLVSEITVTNMMPFLYEDDDEKKQRVFKSIYDSLDLIKEIYGEFIVHCKGMIFLKDLLSKD